MTKRDAQDRPRRHGLGRPALRAAHPLRLRRGARARGQLMSFIQEHADRASKPLAAERGVFPAWHGSIYDPRRRRRGGPAAATRRARRSRRPARSSIIADCSGGIEPAFALAFMRQHYLDAHGHRSPRSCPRSTHASARSRRRGLLQRRTRSRTWPTAVSSPERDDVPRVGEATSSRTAHDIEPEWHVRMQAAFQRHTDNAVSKTINFPRRSHHRRRRRAPTCSPIDEGCKGITVYRDGSRERQVLSHATAPGRSRPKPRRGDRAR